MFKSYLIAISKRISIGVFISIIGLLISFLAHSWKIEVNAFGFIGMCIMGIAGFQWW